MRPTVLLFADHTRGSLKKALERKNVEVVLARTGRDALAAILGKHFDVLITDLCQRRRQRGSNVVATMRHFQPEALHIVLSNSDVHVGKSTVLVVEECALDSADVKKVVELVLTKGRRKFQRLPNPWAGVNS